MDVLIGAIIVAGCLAGAASAIFRSGPVILTIAVVGAVASRLLLPLMGPEAGWIAPRIGEWIFLLLGGGAVGLAAVAIRAKLSARLVGTRIQLSILNRRIVIDRRLAPVAALLLIVLGVTPFFARIASDPHQSEIWLGFYAAWVEDIVFFVVVGFTLAAMSMRLPEHEPFQSRVESLFSGNKGPIVNSLREGIRRMGYYATYTERRLIVEDYSSEYGAYKVRFKTTRKLKNLFDDTASSDISPIAITPDKREEFKSVPDPVGYIFSVKAQDKPDLVTAPTPIPFQGWVHQVHLEIKPNETKEIYTEYVLWCAIGAICDHVPQRVTENFVSSIRNMMTQTCCPVIEIQSPDGAQRHTIPYNGEIDLGKAGILEPHKKISIFKLLEPS